MPEQQTTLTPSASTHSMKDLLPTVEHALLPAPVEPTPAPAAEKPSMLNFIALALKDPAIDVEKLRALLGMQKELLADEARGAFTREMIALEAELPQISKLGTVSLKSKDGTDRGCYDFARWEDMDRVLRPRLAAHHFALTFNSSAAADGRVTVTAELVHEGGHARRAEITLPSDQGYGRNALQALGSTISYAKRYLAEMLLNIVRKGQDDDGAGASKLITLSQAEEIELLLKQAKADRARFMDYFGISAITEMKEADFSAAVNMLLTKARKTKPAAEPKPDEAEHSADTPE